MIRKNGFTMIEIMIVIVIIGMLAVMGGSTYAKSLRRSRDAKRVEDIKTMQKGFEMYYAQNNTYEDSSCSNMAPTTIFPTGLPKDPTTKGDYDCDSTTINYCVCAAVNEEYANSGADCDFSVSPKSYFCASNLQ